MLTLPVSALGSQSSEDAIAHHCTPWPRGEPQLPSIPRLCVTPSEEPVRMPCASPSPFAVRSRVAAPAGGPGAAGRRRFWFGQKGTGGRVVCQSVGPTHLSVRFGSDAVVNRTVADATGQPTMAVYVSLDLFRNWNGDSVRMPSVLCKICMSYNFLTKKGCTFQKT